MQRYVCKTVNPGSIYLFKVHNRNTRKNVNMFKVNKKKTPERHRKRSEICSNVTIKAPNQSHF